MMEQEAKKMVEINYWSYIEERGYDSDSRMYEIFRDIANKFTEFEFAYNYIQGSAKEDIDSAEGNGMHLIIEPVILPPIANALFIAMYGEFEGYLNLICKEHAVVGEHRIKLKDISGSGIERAAAYLSKVVLNDKLKSSSKWNELQHWNKIRNILVHNNGLISKDGDMKSIEFLKLNVNDENKVQLRIKDCDDFNTLVSRLVLLCI